MHRNELRKNPLTGEYVLFAESRVGLPRFRAEHRGLAAPWSGVSPFVAGAESRCPHTLYDGGLGADWAVRVVPNSMPLARVEGDGVFHAEGPYVCSDAVGAHEVIVNARDERPVERHTAGGWREILMAWRARMRDLVRDLRLRSFFVGENVGFAAGGTVGHSVGHLLALGIVPERMERILQNAIALRRRVGRSFFEEVIAFERDRQVRWIKGGKHVAAWCPYASASPYSVVVVPFREEPVFHEIGDEELDELAGMLAGLVPLVSDLTDEAPLQIRLVTAPPRWGEEAVYAGLNHAFRWQVEIVPIVFPEGGNERISGVRVNPVFPETAGAALRAALG